MSVIETKRLSLRHFTWEDEDELSRILSDPETMKFYPSPYDNQGVKKWIRWNLGSYEKRGFGLWVVELKENGRFIGDCGITMQNINGKNVPEIGYHFNKNYWRMGYATEAARACREWFFTHTDFDAVYSYMNAENVGSYSVAKNNGMRLVEEYPLDGVLHKVYRITRDEWELLRKNK